MYLSRLSPLMSRKNLPLAIWIGCQNWPLGGWRFGENGDKRPAPLETGDFGENGNYGEIGDFSQKSSEGWRYPECGIIFKLDAKSGPFKVDN